MDKRKAIVIAVVLFLLIGLGTFVFANPSEERLDGNDTGITDNGNNNEVDGENTDGEEETEQPAEETEDDDVISVIDDGNENTGNGNSGNGNGGSSNNNNGNNNGGSTEEDDSAYLAALAALEKAEASYLQGDLDAANDLISDLADGSDKQGLVDRANALQNVIDVETLVKNLQNQVNTAENIDNVNSARDYRANEDIINKVNNLADSSKKEELKGILSEVAVILDDTTAPGISGIDNGVVTALDVALTVNETNVTVLVNGEEKTLDEIKNITEHGTYKVTVTDQAYNATTIEFTIDKKLPEFNVESGTHSENAMEIVVTDDTFDYMNVTNQDTGVTEKYTTSTITLEDEATYHIYAFDKAGNYQELWIAIDKNPPTINVAGTNVDGYFRDEEVTLTVFDKFLTEVTVNGETFDKDDFTYANNNENATLTKTYTVEGKYEVVAKDKFGHEKTYTFVIDKTAPALKGIENGGVYKEAILEIIEENLHTAEISKDGGKAENFTSGYKVTESGTYYVKIIDKAYNRLEITFTIDADAPVVDVNYSTTEPTNGYVIVTLTSNEEVEITSDSGTWKPNSGFATKFQKSYPANDIQSVTLTDKVGNSTTVEIKIENIDRVVPEILNIKQEYEDAEGGRIKVTFYTSEAIYGEGIDPDTTYDNDHSIRKVSDTEYYTYYYVTKEVTLNFTDAAGNAGSYTFTVDKTAPTVEISYNYENIPTNHNETVTLKFSETITFDGMETWLDKGNNVYQKVFPENTTQEIHFKDSVGNPGTLNIEITWIDKEAPEGYNVGILNVTHYREENPYLNYAKVDDEIRVKVSFREKLETLPTLVLNGVELSDEFFYAEQSSDEANNEYVYMADVILTQEMIDQIKLEDGLITFTIKGYADSVGNVGKDLTNANIAEDATYKEVKFDMTLPQLLNYPESGFTKEDFKIEVNDDVDTIVISKRNSEEESQTVQNGYVLTEEASYIIDITDKAGNKIRYNLGVDKNPPIINGVTDGAYYNHAVSITVDDLQLAGAVWLNNEKYTQGTLIEEEGTYTVTATDRVGNTTSVTFTIDKTPATRDYSTLYFEETGKIAYDIDGNKAYYMKNGDSVVFRMAFHEELKNSPTVTIGGQNVEMTSKGLFQNNDGENIYVYEGTFKIDENESEMSEGKLDIILSNVIDLAGNETTDETVLNQTPTSNNRVIIYDRTSPVVYENNSTGSDDTFSYVSLKLHDANTISSLIINGQDFSSSHSGYWIDLNGNNVVTWLEGENTIEFSDPAGNKTVYKFIVDYQNPEVTSVIFKNIDNADYPNLAKAGDRVWLYVNVNEKLMHDPTVIINGQEATRVQYENGDNWNETWEKYVFQYVVPENAENKEITFEVKNVVDKAGNSLEKTIDNDFTSDEVVVDTNGPALNQEQLEVPRVYVTDAHMFSTTLYQNQNAIRSQEATLAGDNLYSVSFQIGYLPDGNYSVVSTDIAGNTSTVEFKLDRLKISDQVVKSNLIDTNAGTINNFNSFAIKFNQDLTFTNSSLTNGFRIEMEYSVDGGQTYKKSGTVITNFWTEVLGDSTKTKYQGSTFAVTAGSPIYWSGTKVGERYKEIYDAILATAGTENEVYVRTVFTVIQPTYTKSFPLDPVIYSDGGQTVSPRGLAEFN